MGHRSCCLFLRSSGYRRLMDARKYKALIDFSDLAW